MLVQTGIIVVLIIAGVLLYRFGARALSNFMSGTVALVAQPEEPVEPVEPEGPAGPDGLVVLFADRFVARARPGKMVSPRQRCYAPLTEEELDPLHWAFQILYATLATLYEKGSIDMRLVERAATLMPPYPQKSWELQICQVGPMPESPMSDVMAVAFGVLRRRARVEDERHWTTLDALVEHSLKAIRQELTFWQRAGVYGDIRQYVEAALIAQGYLIEPPRPTWLDKMRQYRPLVHEDGVRRLEPDAEALAVELAEFRRKYGGNLIPEEVDELEALKEVDSSLLAPRGALEDIPLDEALRISIYETIQALRQLEPSGDAGV
ncbi:MAG: hypothetical protein J7M38_00965 [Armatimonadetes bacterium]|nr:hypothetical protein [Armatimonadota bacterium]